MTTTIQDEAVFVEIDGAVATVWLNRPERLNAWSSEIAAGLLDTLRALEENPDVRGVILTGSGRAFCAGADLKNPLTHRTVDIDSALDQRVENPGSPHFDLVSHYKKPIVAAVNGYAVGIGCLLPLCCDFIYASRSARFRLPQVALGVMPAYGGPLRLARAVGNLNAAEMILTGRIIDADEALRWGMVTALLDDDELLPYAQRQMQLIASHPQAAVAFARESLKMSLDNGDIRAAERADLHRFMLLSQRSDTAARHQAWREGRGG